MERSSYVDPKTIGRDSTRELPLLQWEMSALTRFSAVVLHLPYLQLELCPKISLLSRQGVEKLDPSRKQL